MYDLDEIAAQLTARADYGALTDLVGVDLAPARLTGTTRTADANDGRDDAGEVFVAEVTQCLSAAPRTPTGDGEQAKIESERGRSTALPATAPPVAPVPAGDNQDSAPQ